MAPLRSLRDEIGSWYGRHGSYSRRVDRLNRLPLLRDFSRLHDAPAFPTREQMWDYLSRCYSGIIDYLEFGVHQGYSILHWAKANTNSASRFVGFDTFTGLPETWNEQYPKGHFDVGGRPPSTSDPRVQFEPGLFQETLPKFLETFIPQQQLVVHLDCDLYSSALFALTQLNARLIPGSVLIFDEFGDVLHEFRAFQDFTTSYHRTFKVIATHDSFFTAALELT